MKLCLKRWLSVLTSLTLSVLCMAVAQLETVQETATYRLVQHAAGETQVPLEPQRIVVLHNVFVEGLLSLGLQPVAAVVREEGFAPQFRGLLSADTVSVGDQNNPNLEAILALEPDLILGQAQLHGELYPHLSAIAPTLLSEEPEEDWRDWLLALGEVLGRPDAAQTALADYDARAAEARQRLAPHAAETVLLLRVRDRDIRVYGGARRAGPVLYADLGLTPHPLVPLSEPHETISLEALPELDADHIFLIVEDAERMSSIRESPLWQSLPAVHSGQVYEVALDPWNRSIGVISFGRIIEDVVAALEGSRR